MMSKLAITALLCGSAISAFAQAEPRNFRTTSDGIIVTPSFGTMRTVEIKVHGDGIFQVIGKPREAVDQEGLAPSSVMAPNPPRSEGFTVTEGAGHVRITARRASADIDLSTGLVRFLDANGSPLLSETAQPTFSSKLVDGKAYVAVSQQFNRNTDEGIYGLGQQQTAEMDNNGEDVELRQQNMVIAVPFLVSTKGYGLLWDNNGESRFGNPRPYAKVGEEMTVTSGGRPGFTASYYLDGKEVASRQETTIDYQYVGDHSKWPEAAVSGPAGKDQDAGSTSTDRQKVVWTGQLLPRVSGKHKFRLNASGYYKLWLNGKLILDHWRPSFNPWNSNFEAAMTAGKPVMVRIEWLPTKGYMSFYHSDPLPKADRHSIWMTSDVAREKIYWFLPGGNIDGAIASYRRLTGKSEMLPKWAYGFWQSRQRYETADQLTGVLDTYRKLAIPIDNIVLDWRYWKDDAWGSHAFDKSRFPDPKAMVDHVHAQNAQIMISVWPKFYPSTDNFKELAAKGHVYRGNLEIGHKDWVGPGYVSTFYDPYSKEGRDIFWRQVRDGIAKFGFDAWWADADEPAIISNSSPSQWLKAMGPTAIGPAAEFRNSYSLFHSQAFFDGWRSFKPDVRPFILSRSGFGGIQRNGTAIWSGDTAGRWWDLKAQIASGVNASMSGLPNWTHDIGGYSVEGKVIRKDASAADRDDWTELQIRWFQFGAFSPLFRSHGESLPREIFLVGAEGSPARKSMIWYDELRYRLMPYIYTLGADTYLRDGSIMRAIAADYPDDIAGREIRDQYLFGDAFLVAPVTEYKARSRRVYFPGKGIWYDFASAKTYLGGQTANIAAPLERMPLFVRAGAIIPMGPVLQYVNEKPDAPLTIAVFIGKDGFFSLYEDDGRSEQYKQGAFSRIELRYDDKARSLSVSERIGNGWPGMQTNRTIRVKWVSPGKPVTDDNSYDAEIAYTGAPVTIVRK